MNRRYDGHTGYTTSGLHCKVHGILPFVTLNSNGIKEEGATGGDWKNSEDEAYAGFDEALIKYREANPGDIYWRRFPELLTNEGRYMVYGRLLTSALPLTDYEYPGQFGWRSRKGPQVSNQSGFRATGHRLLLLPDVTEEKSAGGIVLTAKIVAQDEAKCVIATVIEIGHDAWSDKSTDYCQVGDRVLIGEYAGKLHTSPVDGKRYRFVNDLDIISPLVEA